MKMPKIWNSKIIFAGILFSAVGMAGCSYVINTTAKRAAEAQVKRFKLHVNRVDSFVQCLDKPGGQCPVSETASTDTMSIFSAPTASGARTLTTTRMSRPDTRVVEAADITVKDAAAMQAHGIMKATLVAADLARDVLNDDVQAQLNGIFNVVKGAEPPAVTLATANGNTVTAFSIERNEDRTVARINIPIDKFQSYQEKVEAATLLGGWDALAAESRLFDMKLAPRESRQRAYISHYFKAYFRDGRFFEAKIKGSELKAKIIAKLKERIPGLSDADYEGMASRLFPQYNFDPDKIEYIFGKIKDSGFVTRGGQRMAFPALEASATLGSSEIALPKVDYIAVGSDLIRVLLHGVYDSEMRIPAGSNATGITVPVDPLKENQNTNVGPAEFEQIETRAAQFEGVVSAGTGRLVRGVSFLSLNNEALATAIETAVGLAVRKQIEKVMWCWYECGFNQQLGEMVSGYAATSFGDVIELEITVGGLPEQVVSGEAVPR
jgi:hypothetical protein